LITRQKVLTQYGTDRRQVLFSKSNFSVFSKEKHADLVIVGRCLSQGKASLYEGSSLTTTSSADCQHLWSKVEELSRTRAVVSFSLSALVIQQLKKAIRDLTATHLRFYNEGNTLKIVVFDYVKFHAEYRLPRKVSQTIRYHQTSAVVRDDFSITLLASSFDALPSDYLDFRIGENGICQVNYVKSDLIYLMRNQKLVEPMTVFFSKQVNQNIALVFHPK